MCQYNPKKVILIAHQTFKKNARKLRTLDNIYTVVISADDADMDRDIHFFIHWNFIQEKFEAQLIVRGKTGKYGTMVVNKAFYDHIHMISRKFIGISKVTGVMSTDMYARHQENQRLFPGLQGTQT